MRVFVFVFFFNKDKSNVYTLKFKQIIESWEFDHKETNFSRVIPPPIEITKQTRHRRPFNKKSLEESEGSEEEVANKTLENKKTDNEQNIAISFEKNLKLRRACSVKIEESALDDRRDLVKVFSR